MRPIYSRFNCRKHSVFNPRCYNKNEKDSVTKKNNFFTILTENAKIKDQRDLCLVSDGGSPSVNMSLLLVKE